MNMLIIRANKESPAIFRKCEGSNSHIPSYEGCKRKKQEGGKQHRREGSAEGDEGVRTERKELAKKRDAVSMTYG